MESIDLATPSPELRQRWRDEAINSFPDDENPCPCDVDDVRDEHIAIQAARWGDEQRLEACIAWLHYNYPSVNCAALRAAMHPKPPSLAEEALAEIQSVECIMDSANLGGNFTATFRALERLQQLEQEVDNGKA